MMKETSIPIEKIYVPAKRHREVDRAKVEAIAESIIDEGMQQPIQVRLDKARDRYVLVSGLQRLEAMRALGEAEVPCLIVQARSQ